MRNLKVVLPQWRWLLKLVPWLLLTLLMGMLLWRAQALAGAGLFQSSVPTPTEVLGPTATAPAPTMVPVTPTLTLTPVLTGTSPTVTTEVSPTPTPEPPTSIPTLAPTVVPQPLATATPAPMTDEAQRYPEEAADLRFSWRTLFDSLALGVSYLWLMCGIGVFALLVLAFMLYWLRGRRSTPES